MSLALAHSRHRRAARRLAWTQRNRPALGVAALGFFGLLSLFVAAFALLVVVGIVWFGRFAGTLPSPDELTARSVFQTTPLYAADGTTRLYEITDPQGGRRTIIPLDRMPRTVIEATIATEDPGFFSNPGFEVRSIVRATFDDLTHRGIVSGASTITQQVVRGVIFTPAERQDLSLRRKVREVVLAYQLSHTYTKDEILQVYLNDINYGNRNYGIEAAAEGYFGKTADQLDLAESALLAGLPQAPGYYDPYTRLSDVKDRQSYVLQRMVIQKFITPEQAAAAAAEPLAFADQRHAFVAPHFVTYVADQLAQKLGQNELYRGGDQVTTTLDLRLQGIAEDAVRGNLPALKAAGGNTAAVVVLDPRDGRLLAMVGSANYDDASISGQVNLAVAPIESAGILSPLTYGLALEHGETLISRLDNSPFGTADVNLPTPPGQAQPALVTLSQALGLGLDAPAMRLMGSVGNQSFIDLGTRLGFADFNRRVLYGPNYTVAGARVSPLEVATAYGMLANEGVAHQPYAIDRVIRPNGQVALGGGDNGSNALDPGAAYLVTTTLTDPAARPPGDNALVDVGQPVAVRVSSDGLESWAAGYTSDLVVVVWAGNVRGTKIQSAAPAAQIWSAVTRAALQLRPATDDARPANVVTVSLCKNPGCTQKYDQLALAGTETAVRDANAQMVAAGPTPTASSEIKTPLVDRPATTPTANAPASAEPSDVLVPDVSGLTTDEARQLLGAYGLSSTPLLQYQSGAGVLPGERSVRPGEVIATSPPANQRAAAGSSVLLIVRKN